MLPTLRRTRRSGWVDRPGRGIRMPMLLTNSTGRLAAARRISWKSEWARLWYHQSWPEKQMTPSARPPGSCVTAARIRDIAPTSRQFLTVRMSCQTARGGG